MTTRKSYNSLWRTIDHIQTIV